MHFQQRAQQIQEKLISIRRELHQYPELSMEEYETTKRVTRWLQEAGVTLPTYQLPVGVVAEVVGSEPGPIIALRADIDALPVQEQTGYAFASKVPGRMHACGHDFHTAAMIGAATLLQEQASKLKGRVRFLFQPAEENFKGARLMVKAGALDGVRAIFGMHNKPDLPVGTVGLRTGQLMASVDKFVIHVLGKGGHAAIPDQARDPIVAAAAMVSSLQTVVSRRLSPFHQAVLSICQIHAGTTWNVIPDRASLEGTVRTFQTEVRAQMPQLMLEVVEGLANSHGVKVEFEWEEGVPIVDNDKEMVELVQRVAQQQGLQITEAKQTSGGEDFAIFQEQVPGCYLWMGTSGTEEWHHPQFTLNEETLAISAALFAETAMEALQQLS